MPSVRALLAEREGYLKRGRADRVAQVDAELARYGIAADTEPSADAPSPVEAAVPASDEVEAAVEQTPRRGRARKW